MQQFSHLDKEGDAELDALAPTFQNALCSKPSSIRKSETKWPLSTNVNSMSDDPLMGVALWCKDIFPQGEFDGFYRKLVNHAVNYIERIQHPNLVPLRRSA